MRLPRAILDNQFHDSIGGRRRAFCPLSAERRDDGASHFIHARRGRRIAIRHSARLHRASKILTASSPVCKRHLAELHRRKLPRMLRRLPAAPSHS